MGREKSLTGACQRGARHAQVVRAAFGGGRKVVVVAHSPRDRKEMDEKGVRMEPKETSRVEMTASLPKKIRRIESRKAKI